MLSILYDEYLKWGCPNCGCDAIKGSCVSGGGLTSGTCRHCGIHFEVRSDNPTMKCLYGAYPENPSDPNSEWVKEEAIRIDHPRKGISPWHWEPKDIRPEEGEYWSSRGVGYDLSGFVKTKAGNKIQEFPGSLKAADWLVEVGKSKSRHSASNHIIDCCVGKAKSCGGYVWKYK